MTKPRNRISVLYVHDARFFSGLERALINIFKGLNRRHFIPFFIGSVWSDHEFEVQAKKENVRCFTTKLGFIEKTLNPVRLLIYLFNWLISGIAIVAIIRKNNIDLIHSNSFLSTFYSFIPSLITQKPIIWHENATMGYSGFRRTIIAILSLRVRYFVAASKSVRQHLLALGVNPQKIKVIYNSVDIDGFKQKPVLDLRKKYHIPKSATVVGLVGQLSPWKGQIDFIQAANLVCQKDKQVYFLIIGQLNNSEYEQRLQDLVARKKLQRRVIFTNRIKNVVDIYSNLDILVMATTTQEPSALVLYESMAGEIPVIATNVGGNPELITQNKTGVLIPPNNPKAMSNAILNLVNNPKLRNILGRNGRKMIMENYSHRKITQLFEDTYQEVVTRKKK